MTLTAIGRHDDLWTSRRSLHITCDVPYDIQVTSSTDLKQVSHLDGVTFTPQETSLDIRVDVPSRLVVDVRDADTNAPFPDAVLALNGTIVNRGRRRRL